MKYRVWRMRGLLILSALFIALYFIPTTLYSIQAADSTPSADLQSKINELKAEIASKAAKLKTEVNQRLQNKVYAGIVTTKSPTQVILERDSISRVVVVNDYTAADKPFNKGDFIVALGDVDDKGSLVAKKLIKQPPPKDDPQVIWGKIQSISSSQLFLQERDGKIVNVTTSSSTNYKYKDQDISFDDLDANKFIVAVGAGDKPSRLSARFIYLIPSGGFIKLPPHKVASNSATPQATKK